MFDRSSSWFIFTFVAVAIATGSSGQESNTGSSAAEPVQEVTHNPAVTATQGWNDAIRSQPKATIKVTQLLSQLPPDNSFTAPADSGSSPYVATQPHSNHSSRQSPATAAPTLAAQTEPQTDDDRISLLRCLSREDKGIRLRLAAQDGAVGELEALLAAGADVDARDFAINATAVHWAAWKGREEAVRRLLAAGAAVDARDGEQETPLHWAARHGQVAVVRLLLAAGADHDARADNGWTPLHLAAYYDYKETAAALLEAGADRAARNDQGRTPLDEARGNDAQQVVDLLEGNTSVTSTA